MIAGPWVLIGLPLIVAPLVYVVRRWAFLSALLSGGMAAALAWLCVAASSSHLPTFFRRLILLGQPVVILGRELKLLPESQLALGFLFGLAAASFLLAWPFSAGRSFFSLGLVLLSGWSSALLTRPLAFSVAILWLTSALATMVIQDGRLGSARGGGRQMVMVTLAVPLLLLVSTLIERRSISPDDFLQAQAAVLLTVLGLAILLASFPFEAWVSSLVMEARPGSVALLVTGHQVVVLLLTLDLFRDQPWLVVDGQILSLLVQGGLLAAAIGGGLAAVQRHFAPLLGYTTLSDLGAGLVALAVAGRTGLSVAFLIVTARALSLLLAGAGLGVLHSQVGTTAFARMVGLGRRLPLATIGLLVGGLSLGGFPLTVGFVPRWALLNQVASVGGPWVWVLLFSSLGVVTGWLRGARVLYGPLKLPASEPASPRRLSLVAGLLVIALAVACLWLGLHPDWLLAWLRPLVDAYAPFVSAPSSSVLPLGLLSS